MSRYTIISPGEIEIGSIRIFLDHGDNDSKFRNKRRSDAYYMAKPLGYLHSYDELCAATGLDARRDLNLLEIGIFEGGSAVFFDRYFPVAKMTCIDFMPEVATALERYAREHGNGRITQHVGIDQANKEIVSDIVESEFSQELDLVIDDASHWYEPSRASFEAVFPYLREGGVYVIEDWSWVHDSRAEKADHMWAGINALTNLVFRLVMVHGTDLSVISRIGFSAGFMWVQKGVARLPKRSFTLSPYERPRGRDIPIF